MQILQAGTVSLVVQALLRSGALAASIANAVQSGLQPDDEQVLANLLFACGFEDPAAELAPLLSELSAALRESGTEVCAHPALTSRTASRSPSEQTLNTLVEPACGWRAR